MRVVAYGGRARVAAAIFVTVTVTPRPRLSAKRVIRRAPANRPSVIARSPADAYLALVLLRLRGTSSHAIGLPNVKNPTPIEQDQGVQLQKASANPGQQALIRALAVIASPALACLQVSTMAYTG